MQQQKIEVIKWAWFFRRMLHIRDSRLQLKRVHLAMFLRRLNICAMKDVAKEIKKCNQENYQKCN